MLVYLLSAMLVGCAVGDKMSKTETAASIANDAAMQQAKPQIPQSKADNTSSDAKKAVENELLFEARSACGNQPEYTVKGKTYKVLESAQGYTKSGLASWYGAEYHGSETASCDKFDMHAYTAAHRTLPLPTFVRVTNKDNGKSVVLKVNDRGPFESKNLIEVSFAAASALDMIRKKRARVKIEALTPAQFKDAFSRQELYAKTDKSLDSRQDPTQPKDQQDKPKPIAEMKPLPEVIPEHALDQSKVHYVRVGTYKKKNQAFDMFVRLRDIGLSTAEMGTHYPGGGQKIYYVRVGPLKDQDQIDRVRDRLRNDGLTRYKVISK